MSDSERVPVGRIVGAFGIRGQVKVEPLTEYLERFDNGAILFLDSEPVRVAASQVHKGRILLSLDGITSATDAEKLQWKILEAEPLVRPELKEDEFLTRDLIGLEVQTEDGRRLGKVDQVLAYPAHDILAVGKLLIPAVKEFVLSVDLEAGEIVVRLLEGMEE